LDEAAGAWDVKVLRYEIKDLVSAGLKIIDGNKPKAS
jgi:hypothetical protein